MIYFWAGLPKVFLLLQTASCKDFSGSLGCRNTAHPKMFSLTWSPQVSALGSRAASLTAEHLALWECQEGSFLPWVLSLYYRIPTQGHRKKHLWLAPCALEAERTGLNLGSATPLSETTDKLLTLLSLSFFICEMGILKSP